MRAHRYLILLLVLLAFWAAPAAARAQTGPETISLAEFHRLIADHIAFLTDSKNSSQWEQSIIDLQTRLQEIAGVELENGDIVPVDSAFLDPEDAGETRARLRLLASQLEMAAQDNTEQRMILLRQGLAELGKNQAPEQKSLPKIKPHPNPDLSVIDLLLWIIQWGVILLGIGALIYVLGIWLSKLMGAFVDDATLQQQLGDEEMPVTARQAREMARKMAQTGNYRAAVRQLYLSALLKLEETGIAPHDRSKTNLEILAAVAGNKAVHRSLQPVVSTFDQVWYGVREPDDATFRAYQRQIEQLNQVLSQHQAAQPADGSNSEA